jgi:hypothetical protein
VSSALIDFVQAHRGLVLWMGTASLVLLVVTVAALPTVVANLPEDYFARPRRSVARRGRRYRFLWAVLAIVQNALGIAFIVAGLLMLVLPGQGILTILVGLAIANFPGKYALERALIRRAPVRKALDRLRARAGRPPLILPGPADAEPPGPDASG